MDELLALVQGVAKNNADQPDSISTPKSTCSKPFSQTPVSPIAKSPKRSTPSPASMIPLDSAEETAGFGDFGGKSA
ncbi:MAG: hypothetical protein QM813_05910 [Verrucomicrobiota bacterium]